MCFNVPGFLSHIITLLLKPSLQLKILVSPKTIAFQPGLKLVWLFCTSNQLLVTGSKLNHDWLLKDRFVPVF